MLGDAPFEGAFAEPRRSFFPSLLAGAGMLVAGPGDLALGRFGYADLQTGIVTNARTSVAQIRGFVIPRFGYWDRVYYNCGVKYLRQGLMVTLCERGSFWARFPGGAYAGDPVYADQLDGHAVSGEATGAELTPWSVNFNAAPGKLAVISTSAYFGVS